jgi:histidine triad (HIT) family protein
MECIFCKIIKREIPSEIVYENSEVIAFEDIEPKTPVHILVIPRKHIPSVEKLEEGDKELVGKLVLVARKLAREKGIDKTGYRLVFNIGKDAGHTVDHLHLHLLGGRKLLFA